MTWHDEDQGIPAGHRLSFKDSLHTASVDITIKLLFPDLLLKYGTPRLRKVRAAYQELGVSGLVSILLTGRPDHLIWRPRCICPKWFEIVTRLRK